MHDLTTTIERGLPPELVGFLRALGAMVAYQGDHLYLVGGVVRDLLLGRRNLDVDLVVEGDGLAVARQSEAITGGRLTVHSRFRTASLSWGKWRIDFVTARSETYQRPGALPRVRPGPLKDDLFRRDFTLNAMAVQLNPSSFGSLTDPRGGLEDIGRRLIRVLHAGSFTDDATRMWRAVRYEQRLGFRIEPETLEWLTRDLARLDTISGDRMRREVRLALEEESPERVLLRAGELGVLAGVLASLRADGWLAERFREARRIGRPSPATDLYWALLTYRMDAGEIESLGARLRLPRRLMATLRDTSRLRAAGDAMAGDLTPSRVTSALDGHSPTAVIALSLAADSEAVRTYARRYLDEFRHVRPALTGDDLRAMGVTPGPIISDMLGRLRAARLDGVASDRADEERLISEWTAT
jgi:tRNA nucleotidyltransferase (CCA-adding enzyme)